MILRVVSHIEKLVLPLLIVGPRSIVLSLSNTILNHSMRGPPCHPFQIPTWLEIGHAVLNQVKVLMSGSRILVRNDIGSYIKADRSRFIVVNFTSEPLQPIVGGTRQSKCFLFKQIDVQIFRFLIALGFDCCGNRDSKTLSTQPI